MNKWHSLRDRLPSFPLWAERRFLFNGIRDYPPFSWIGGEREEPKPEEAGEAEAEKKYVVDYGYGELLKGSKKENIEKAWKQVFADHEVKLDEVHSFANALYVDVMEAADDEDKAKEMLSEMMPTTTKAVISIALQAGLTDGEALIQAGEAKARSRARGESTRGRGTASPERRQGDGEKIREQIREVKKQEYKMQKEIKYMRSRLCRIRRDSPDYRSKYGQFLLVRTQLRRKALDLVKKYEEETGERYITGEGLRAMQKKALELQYPTDSSLVEGMSPRERAIEESELQHVVSSAPPDNIRWDPATLSIYHRAKRFGGNPGHTVMRIQDEARSARLHREVVDDICSDAWARRNLSEASLRKPPQYVFRAPTEYVEGIKKAGLEWSSVPYVETGMSIRDRGRSSHEKSADRAHSVAEEMFYDKFNDEMMRGEYDKYAGLPGYEEFREEIRRKIKYWEKYPDRNDPKSRFGDLARIRAMKLEMDKRYANRQENTRRMEEIVNETEAGRVGAYRRYGIDKLGGFRPTDTISVTGIDGSGRHLSYTIKPYYELMTGDGRLGSNSKLLASEKLEEMGIVCEPTYTRSGAEYHDGRSVVTRVDFYFRQPGVFTVHDNEKEIPIRIVLSEEYTMGSDDRVLRRKAVNEDRIGAKEKAGNKATEQSFNIEDLAKGIKAEDVTLYVYNDQKNKYRAVPVYLRNFGSSGRTIEKPGFTVRISDKEKSSNDPKRFTITFSQPGTYRVELGNNRGTGKHELPTKEVKAGSPSTEKRAPSLDEAHEALLPIRAEYNTLKNRLDGVIDGLGDDVIFKKNLLDIRDSLVLHYPAPGAWDGEQGWRLAISENLLLKDPVTRKEYVGPVGEYDQYYQAPESMLNELFIEFRERSRVKAQFHESFDNENNRRWYYILQGDPVKIMDSINKLLDKIEGGRVA